MVRMDLHGAYVEVVRARDVGLVGVNGVLVKETANTIVVVTKRDKAITVAKVAAVVRIEVLDLQVEVFLAGLRYRAAERSARKIKKRYLGRI